MLEMVDSTVATLQQVQFENTFFTASAGLFVKHISRECCTVPEKMVGNDEFVNAEFWIWINRLNVINRNENDDKCVQFCCIQSEKVITLHAENQ